MSSETLLNSTNNKTLINTSSNSEVDNLTGIVVLDKYTLLKRMNDPSGEAAIYMAVRSPSLNSPDQNSTMAVKIYRRQDAVKPEVLNKLADLKSSGIVEIIDHGFYNSFPCIVMPYYMNGSLAGKTLSYDEIKDIVIPEVTEGLKYLHENGIIHKDIKPANLMISNDGKHVHIIDFGISSAKDDGVSVLITKTGMSPEYCAPETFNNVWVEESDFYSLGITLFELFKGHTPFNYSSDRDALAASASIQKIRFSLDFPEELVNLIKGLTYKDLSNRNDLNNPNRRWTWKEVERWLNGEYIPVPGELNYNNQTSDLPNNTNKSSAYVFSKPYDFRNNKGQVVKLNNLSEFIKAFGLNWDDGRKHVGRGFASKFFIQQDMQSIANIILDCEEGATTHIAYAKMLIELGLSTNNLSLYWNSVKIDNIRYLSDKLNEKLFNQSNDLDKEFENVKQLLCFWYETIGNTEELGVINNLQKIAEADNQDLPTRVVSLCSLIDPNLIIKIGNDIFQNTDELENFTNKAKLDKHQYFEWLLNNQNDITRYTCCVIPSVKQITEHLLQDLMSELNRREEQKRKQREEHERKQREEHERKQREEHERKQREEHERRQREIQIFGKAISDIKIGSIITYGRYFQDSDSNKSPIEWLVLDVQGNEALIVSKYALDCKQYHKRWNGITWEACELRTWLNNDFIKSAFSDEETKMITVSELKNDDNPEYRTRSGNNTKDRIFCLSIAEAEKYFSRDKDRICKPTTYARQQWANVNWANINKRGETSYWWLRSTGLVQYYVSYIEERGKINQAGCHIYHYHNAVRPALRIIFDEEQIHRISEEKAHREREEQARREREEQTRREKKEQARREREEQARREKEEQARREREEQARREREEQAHREKENLEPKHIFMRTIGSIQKGEFVRYGNYYQDSSVQKSPIEWLVLDVKGNEVLLISRYALYSMYYHNSWSDITWKDCDLRKWINSDFLKSAFSKEESERILVSELTIDDNPGRVIETRDKVFCLSIAEAEKYFSSDNDRKCMPTVYARQRGAIVYNGCCYWWLRSPGSYHDRATFVGTNGALDMHGGRVNNAGRAVRLALRIACDDKQSRKEREARRENEKQLRGEKEEKACKERDILAQEERKQELAMTYLLLGLILVVVFIVALSKMNE